MIQLKYMCNICVDKIPLHKFPHLILLTNFCKAEMAKF